MCLCCVLQHGFRCVHSILSPFSVNIGFTVHFVSAFTVMTHHCRVGGVTVLKIDMQFHEDAVVFYKASKEMILKLK